VRTAAAWTSARRARGVRAQAAKSNGSAIGVGAREACDVAASVFEG